MRYVVLLLLLLLTVAPARAQFIFQKAIGTGPTSNERASQMIALRSGGYALAGTRNGLPYVARVTEQGDTLWTRTYPFAYTLFSSGLAARSITENISGQLLVACGGSRRINGRFDSGGVLLLADNADGHVIWSRLLQSPYPDYYNAVCPSNDRRHFLVASRQLGIPLVQKMDSVGTVLWTATLFGTDTANFDVFTLLPVPGGYVIGFERSDIFPYIKQLIRLNEQGQEVWRRNSYLGNVTPLGARAENGNWLFTGSRLVKMNSQGDTIWTRSYAPAGIKAIALTADSNYIALGERYYQNQQDLVLLKIAQDGRLIRDTTFARSIGSEFARTILTDTQGDYVCFGDLSTSSIPPVGMQDLLLFKYRQWRHVLRTAPPLADNRQIALEAYPNPVQTHFRLRATSPLAGELRLCDLLGRVIAHYAVTGAEAAYSMEALPAGVYLLTYQPEDGMPARIGRVVKQ